jgi:hypothetical protein
MNCIVTHSGHVLPTGKEYLYLQIFSIYEEINRDKIVTDKYIAIDSE